MKKIMYWLPVIIWCSLIFWLSGFHKLEASPIGWQDFIIRKTAHMGEYAILFWLIFRALRKTSKLNRTKGMFYAFVLAVGYALTDEYHQTLVSGRTGRFFDIGVDTLGVSLALFVSNLTKKVPVDRK